MLTSQVTKKRFSGAPTNIEVKFAPCDLKRARPDGIFEGYASLFGHQDLGRDIVLPGAFRESLGKRGAHGIKMLFQHDPNEPIGIWLELREDHRGLYAKGRLMREVARAREVLSLMQAGALEGLSIGFRTIDGRRDPKTGIRRLRKIDLWEISIVTFPMLPGARVSAIKHRLQRNGFPTEREFERWLTQDAGFSRSEARTLIGAGFKSLATKREAAGLNDETAHLARLMRQAAKALRKSIA